MTRIALFGDLKSPALLYLKGGLFLLLGVIAGGLLLYESPTLKTAALLAVCVWAFCRWYYFVFYVIDRYAGGERYAGVFDFVRRGLMGRAGDVSPSSSSIERSDDRVADSH